MKVKFIIIYFNCKLDSTGGSGTTNKIKQTNNTPRSSKTAQNYTNNKGHTT
jgi:hypothetical protein